MDNGIPFWHLSDQGVSGYLPLGLWYRKRFIYLLRVPVKWQHTNTDRLHTIPQHNVMHKCHQHTVYTFILSANIIKYITRFSANIIKYTTRFSANIVKYTTVLLENIKYTTLHSANTKWYTNPLSVTNSCVPIHYLPLTLDGNTALQLLNLTSRPHTQKPPIIWALDEGSSNKWIKQ